MTVICDHQLFQVFVTADYAAEDPERFERNIYLLRKQAVNNMAKQSVDCYICSLSTTTIVYKVGVLDFERDPEAGIEMLRQEGKRAVEEDNAEAILLGCAGMAEFADSLEKELGVPVIDGVVAGVKFAEAIVDLGKKTSKLKTYKYPEKKEYVGALENFGLNQTTTK